MLNSIKQLPSPLTNSKEQKKKKKLEKDNKNSLTILTNSLIVFLNRSNRFLK
jgi:hypothetical protein